jgi:hypothetical protein
MLLYEAPALTASAYWSAATYCNAMTISFTSRLTCMLHLPQDLRAIDLYTYIRPTRTTHDEQTHTQTTLMTPRYCHPLLTVAGDHAGQTLGVPG